MPTRAEKQIRKGAEAIYDAYYVECRGRRGVDPGMTTIAMCATIARATTLIRLRRLLESVVDNSVDAYLELARSNTVVADARLGAEGDRKP